MVHGTEPGERVTPPSVKPCKHFEGFAGSANRSVVLSRATSTSAGHNYKYPGPADLSGPPLPSQGAAVDSNRELRYGGASPSIFTARMLDLSLLLRDLALLLPTGYPSFAVVASWMVTGALLLILGWAGLVMRPTLAGEPAGASTGARRAARTVGGALLALTTSLGVTVGIAFVQHAGSVPSLVAGIPRGTIALEAAAAFALGAISGALSGSTRWRLAGVSAWMGLAFLAVGFVGYAGLVVAAAAGAFAIGLGLALVALESFGLFLMLAYQFYALETIASDGPGSGPRATTPRRDSPEPRVAVQVAAFNEPVAVVKSCLESLLALDYPVERRVIQLLDDSTVPEISSELERLCRTRGIAYLHRTERRGFKAGALNDGLRELPKDIELIAIVDADYQVERGFLRSVVAPFDDPSVGFVQTPQSYRNVDGTGFGRRYALADAYFYHVVEPVRARFQSAIFCGTMGILRRRALEGAGGWSEECITEDAELSVRLVTEGWRVVYLTETFGRGLAPLTMAGVRSQHRRWAYGGVQMLRMNRKRLASPTVSRRQWADFWVGGMFWTDGFFFIGMALVMSLVAAGSWFGYALPSPSAWALALAASAPVLLLWDGILKIRLALGRSVRTTLRDVFGIVAFWYAVKLNDLRAALRGLVGGRQGFVRTPKARVKPSSRRGAFSATVRATAVELVFGLALFAVDGVTLYRTLVERVAPLDFAAVFLLVWIAYYALAFVAAPVLDYGSRRAPADAGEIRPKETLSGLPEPVAS